MSTSSGRDDNWSGSKRASDRSAGASNQWPGDFHPASVDRVPSDDRLAPHRALDERGVPEINAYAPTDTERVIFHELDADLDPSGQAFIKAPADCVFNARDLR